MDSNDPPVSPGITNPPKPVSRSACAAAFARTDTWIFDLDNTLYPPAMNLFAQIDRRMTDFVARRLNVTRDAALTLQKRLFHEYGTTLAGLMREHAMDPHEFLEHVHDVDVSVLSADPALATALETLPGRRLIYTNGSVAHALRVTERLGIAHLFDGIHDIAQANFAPKPSPAAFREFIARFAIAPKSAAFFDDIPHNLQPAHDEGMITVWVDQPSSWSRPGGEGPHIHHRTASLHHFLSLTVIDKDSE